MATQVSAPLLEFYKKKSQNWKNKNKKDLSNINVRNLKLFLTAAPICVFQYRDSQL